MALLPRSAAQLVLTDRLAICDIARALRARWWRNTATRSPTRCRRFGAEVKLLGPDEYGAYLKTQVQLFSAGLKTLNSN